MACHNPSYVDKYDMVSDLKENGTFLLNCGWTAEELSEKLPADMKRILARRNIKLYTIDGVSIGKEIGLGSRINMIMQAAFFKLANIIPLDDAVTYMKDAIQKTYGRKGEKIVNMNYQAVDRGIQELKKIEIPADWADAVDEAAASSDVPEFISDILEPMNRQEGDKLPVSAFVGREDGTFPCGTSRYEKRGIAVDVPEWQMDKCIQCNQCAYVCPHAAIRPFLLDEEEVKNAPEGFESKKAIGKGMEGLNFRIQVSVLDCAGCGSCANVCPSREKALLMKPLETQYEQAENWEYAMTIKPKNPMGPNTVKGSQFQEPLLEFSGACAGCGETPYAKLITQLFGDRMMIANATGCSSIWGGSAPSMPYCANKEGHGPSWANSLFEDNAEFGYGMYLAVKQIRSKIADNCAKLLEMDIPADVKAALEGWLENMNDGDGSKAASAQLKDALNSYKGNASGEAKALVDEILENSEFLVKKSVWILGGDGWAYDIGFGGLDHVLASNEDINVLVFDTEVYSNTGGQSSKATPAGAVAPVRCSGQEDQKERSRHDGHVLWICLCCTGGNGSQPVTAHKGDDRSREVRRTFADNRVLTVHKPRDQAWNGPVAA